MHAIPVLPLGILAGALFWDWVFGEYPTPLHPVVWIGRLATFCLRFAPSRGWWGPFLFGCWLALFTTGLVVLLTILSLRAASIHTALTLVVGIFLLKASFALSALGTAAEGVLHPLKQGDLAVARHGLRSLCSRDASDLNADELLAATIESVAENASDSFVAPLFYFCLFGIPGALGYRAINTLDAMIGYRGRFEALGKASARLDDVVNWLPARLTAWLLLLAGGLCGKSAINGWRILRRDGPKTPSPNAGRPMAAMAGLLGVELTKKGIYVLGEPTRPVSIALARDAWWIVVAAGMLMVALTIGGVSALG